MTKPIRDTSKSLASELKALDKLESETYTKFNAIINPFDPSIPLTKQFEKDPEKMQKLLAVQQDIKEQREFRLALTSELLEASPSTKQTFWAEYSKDKNAQVIFEDFIGRMDKGKGEKTSNEALLASKADVLNIMAFEAGQELIMKININLEGKELSIIEEQDYVCAMKKEDPKFLEKQGHDAQDKAKIREYGGHDDAELKALYKKDKHKHQKGDVSTLTGLDILVPTPDPSSLLLNIAKNPQGQAMLSITPPYRAFYHELCHAHRDLKGANKRTFAIPNRYRHLYSQNAEELWAINLGKSSEKTLSSQDHLPARITHSGFNFYVKDGKLVSNKDPKEIEHSDSKIAERLFSTRAMLGETDFSGIVSFDHPEDVIIEIDNPDGTRIEHFKANDSQIRIGISGGDFISPSFKNAKLEKSLIYCNITGGDFSNAVLKESKFSTSAIKGNISVKNTNFSNADLSKASFNCVKIENGNFTNANLVGVRLQTVIFTDVTLKGANLQNVDFTNKVTLSGKIDLSGADLRGANLTGVDLTGVNLQGADLRGAKLTGAKLDGANLTGAKLDNEVLKLSSVNFARIQHTGFNTPMHMRKMQLEHQRMQAAPIQDKHDKIVNSLLDALKDLSETEKEEIIKRENQKNYSPGFKAITFVSKPLRVDKDKKDSLAQDIVIMLDKAKTLASPQKEKEIMKIIDEGLTKNKKLHKNKPSKVTESRLNSLLEQAKIMLSTDPDAGKRMKEK